MYDLVKFEGRINKLEIHEGTLNTLANTGDNQITSSAILSSVAESVSLGAQTVFLASQSRLHIQSVVMEIDGKICIGKFHRALIVENEYVICVVRRLEKNLYELYSVLSPKTGLLHMQVGMGGGVKKSYSSAIKGARVWYLLGMVILTIIILISGDFDKETLLSWGGGSSFYFTLFYYLLLRILLNRLNIFQRNQKKYLRYMVLMILKKFFYCRDATIVMIIKFF